MKRNLTQSLKSWIENGACSIGQIQITPLPAGGYELRHIADADSTELARHTDASAARALSFFTDAEEYRPLKTAPTLRRGWSLTLKDANELRLALDHFYPAMTALWLSHLEGKLSPVPLRETLGRQTGMYAATKRLLDDEGQQLVGSACAASNCLKQTIWPFAENQPLTHLPVDKTRVPSRGASDSDCQIPLLCHEACNILVAACREVVKKRERAAAQPA